MRTSNLAQARQIARHADVQMEEVRPPRMILTLRRHRISVISRCPPERRFVRG